MRFKFWSSMLIPVAGLALLAALPVAAAEDEKSCPAAPEVKDTRPIPRLPIGKPDLSGGVGPFPVSVISRRAPADAVGNTPGRSAVAEQKEYPLRRPGKPRSTIPRSSITAFTACHGAMCGLMQRLILLRLCRRTTGPPSSSSKISGSILFPPMAGSLIPDMKITPDLGWEPWSATGKATRW